MPFARQMTGQRKLKKVQEGLWMTFRAVHAPRLAPTKVVDAGYMAVQVL